MSNIQANDTLRQWRESASYCEKQDATIRAMFAPHARALIEEAGIVQLDSVSFCHSMS
ncbi:MAG: hypothetical protein M3R67_14720 [Acidobacteriota bacterium]|nr:hypothetical protein [Acidobacteriota bacterium]